MQNGKKISGQILKGIQWSSGIAALITGILLAATLIQMRIHGPLVAADMSGFAQLIERNPTDQNLRDEVRALDMLARKAYFTSQHQLNAGTVIFFIALGIFLILWNIRATLFPAQPAPPGEKVLWWKQQTQAAKAVAFAGAAFVIIIVLYGINDKYQLTSAIFAHRDVGGGGHFSQWWMNFRGPNGHGVAAFANAPLRFNGETMEGIRWKVETPLEGFSSPAVYDNKIFLTGGNAESRRVFCFDADNGKLLWSREVRLTNLPPPRVDRETGFAAPSAAVDGKRVFAVFATGELAAFTLGGKQVWTKFLGTPDNHYGHASSLIAQNGLLFVQFDQYDKGKLLAIDGRSGKTVWEAPRTILSWASPILIDNNGRRELIVVDNEYVSSYDPASGKLLWSKDCLFGEVGPSAAYANGMVFTANEYAAASGIDLTSTDEESNPVILWQWRDDLPNTASPVAIDTLLFLATTAGTVSCLSAKNGTTLWAHLFEKGFYSSPIVSGGNVFLFDRGGVMHVFAASPEFELIASSPIGEPVTTTPAILDGYMIVRGDKYLYRIDGI